MIIIGGIMNSEFKIILGVVGSDVHCVANQLLEAEFSLQGYSVLNLGVALAEEEVLQNINGDGNEIILLGTINGDIEPTISVIKAIRTKFNNLIPVIVGGNVVLGAVGKDRTLDLIEAGATMIISNSSSISEVVLRVQKFIKQTNSIKA